MDRETLVKQGLVTSTVSHPGPTRSWSCRVTAGPDEERRVLVGARPVVIGADAACDLTLSDPSVSRRHLEIHPGPEGLRVRDLESTNGSFYMGSRFTELVIPDASTIEVGDTSLHLSSRRRETIPPSARTRFGGLVGQSLAMRELYAVLELASPTDVTVLIEGESGTGKELVARALHDHSARATGPFVVVDCGATSPHLVESQLFGHRRGAFTGANADRRGAFSRAHGGTLFLDEIGELPLPLQPKLLRALEARTITPLGADRPEKIDVRIVAATNRELGRMVEEGHFRFDLFQRLAVVHVRLPPLRARTEDIPALVAYFYEGRGTAPGEIAGDNLRQLVAHRWPGNVRELRNTLDRAWVLSGPTPDTATFAELQLSLEPAASSSAAVAEPVDITLPFKAAKERWLERFERRYLAALYAACDHNLSEAARRSGINRNHFRKLLQKHQLLEG